MILALRWVFCADLIRTAGFALYVIHWLVFITVVESVYNAVRTGCLYKADFVSFFKGSAYYSSDLLIRNCLPRIGMFLREDLKPGICLTVQPLPGSFWVPQTRIFFPSRTRLPILVTSRQDAEELYIVRSFMICSSHQIFWGSSNQVEWAGMGM